MGDYDQLSGDLKNTYSDICLCTTERPHLPALLSIQSLLRSHILQRKHEQNNRQPAAAGEQCS